MSTNGRTARPLCGRTMLACCAAGAIALVAYTVISGLLLVVIDQQPQSALHLLMAPGNAVTSLLIDGDGAQPFSSSGQFAICAVTNAVAGSVGGMIVAATRILIRR